MLFTLDEVHPSWHPFFALHLNHINEILAGLSDQEILPNRGDVFRAFRFPLDDIQVLILGQDPYPGPGVADGLAFSSAAKVIPASLRNIFKEYSDDLGYVAPASADLSRWAEHGVLLLNRTLTTAIGERNAHSAKGWMRFTYEVAQYLAERKVVAILWGANARELAPLFDACIESPHPSPLSARRGFFGSKPFSRVNQILRESGRKPIDWKL